ncbi:MAG: hypothetical protein JW913_08180 [Chitinispirillaceae bacterium]|nr:hypothetical protein [Chitinispirillaceae bacterium]
MRLTVIVMTGIWLIMDGNPALGQTVLSGKIRQPRTKAAASLKKFQRDRDMFLRPAGNGPPIPGMHQKTHEQPIVKKFDGYK